MALIYIWMQSFNDKSQTFNLVSQSSHKLSYLKLLLFDLLFESVFNCIKIMFIIRPL